MPVVIIKFTVSVIVIVIKATAITWKFASCFNFHLSQCPYNYPLYYQGTQPLKTHPRKYLVATYLHLHLRYQLPHPNH